MTNWQDKLFFCCVFILDFVNSWTFYFLEISFLEVGTARGYGLSQIVMMTLLSSVPDPPSSSKYPAGTTRQILYQSALSNARYPVLGHFPKIKVTAKKSWKIWNRTHAWTGSIGVCWTIRASTQAVPASIIFVHLFEWNSDLRSIEVDLEFRFYKGK